MNKALREILGVDLLLKIAALRLTVVYDTWQAAPHTVKMPLIKLLRGDKVLFVSCTEDLELIKQEFAGYIAAYEEGARKAMNPKTDGHPTEVSENMVKDIETLRIDYLFDKMQDTLALFRSLCYGPKTEILLLEALALLEQAKCKAKMAVIESMRGD